MTRSMYQKEYAMGVSRGALPEPYKYRDRNEQPTIGLSLGSMTEDLDCGSEELKGYIAPWEEQ